MTTARERVITLVILLAFNLNNIYVLRKITGNNNTQVFN